MTIRRSYVIMKLSTGDLRPFFIAGILGDEKIGVGPEIWAHNAGPLRAETL